MDGERGAGVTIGELSARSGVSISALRFYERRGLIAASRTAGNQRRFPRATLRRVAFIRISQRVGMPLAAIRDALDSLPGERTPTRADWADISRRWRADLDARIADLQHLRDDLSGCIGCGCLSLDTCGLRNPEDRLGLEGTGSRLWDAEPEPGR